MRRVSILFVAILAFAFSGCKDDEPKLDPVIASLVSSLDDELKPLAETPGSWKNDELKFLDAYANIKVLGLGEATHGTSEFFKAKHRIFKYMVEVHGYRVFAIEADVGESILINEAVLSSNKSNITKLMTESMHFWTWRTNEVRELLYWMCDYNVGKPEAQKVQYVGVDCQFNTFHPDMALTRLRNAQVSFLPYAEAVLGEAKSEARKRFSTYDEATFLAYIGKLKGLADSVKTFDAPTRHLVDVVRQVSEVMYYAGKSNRNYRDEYMADNASWIQKEYNSKVVLWAHNYHVADFKASGTMGYHLEEEFKNDYASIGFLFAKGSFRAITFTNNQAGALKDQTLDTDPLEGSINAVMSHAETPAFTVSVNKLQGHSEWQSAFAKGMKYFQMGSGYNGTPADYYSTFDPAFFNELIFFSKTTPALEAQ